MGHPANTGSNDQNPKFKTSVYSRKVLVITYWDFEFIFGKEEL